MSREGNKGHRLLSISSPRAIRGWCVDTKRLGWFLGVIVVLTMVLSGCQPASQALPDIETDQRLQVLATTSIVGDVVQQVGGESIDLAVLLPVGTDPHSFQPTPQEVVSVSEADVVFINGLGLEQFLNDILSNAVGEARVVSVSEGIMPRESQHSPDEDPEHAEADAHEHADQTVRDGDDAPADGDPHVWVDPNNVMAWTENIVRTLAELDPANAGVFRANGDAYLAALQELDAWIRNQVEAVPEGDRKIITDHMLFGYFVDRYGFEQIGAIVSGYSSMAAPSAQELAALEDAIQDMGVKVVFVGNTVNPDLAARVAGDTGVDLVFLYTGSLSEPGGDADSYLDFMRYNVNAIVGALQ